MGNCQKCGHSRGLHACTFSAVRCFCGCDGEEIGSGRITDLEAENTLMNELVKDLKQENENLHAILDRMSGALLKAGWPPTEIRNLIDG